MTLVWEEKTSPDGLYSGELSLMPSSVIPWPGIQCLAKCEVHLQYECEFMAGNAIPHTPLYLVVVTAAVRTGKGSWESLFGDTDLICSCVPSFGASSSLEQSIYRPLN